MNIKQPLVTITMSTYNVEDYINESINSIINQTFKDFELICIDDGSSDNTLKILKEFEAKDARINVIAKRINEGLAVARNESLKLAKGKYITFLDGDDIYDTTLFEKAVSLAEKEQSDIVYWDYLPFYDVKEIPKLQKQTSALLGLNPKNKKALLKRPSFTWVKIIRTEKARKLKIHFPKGYTRQDIPVHWKLVTQINKVSILPEKLAFYRQQPNATTAKKDTKLFHLVYVMDIVKTYLEESNLFEAYKNEFYTQQINFFSGMYDNIKSEYKKEALVLIKERLEATHYNFINTTNLVRPQAKYFLKSLKGDFVSKIRLNLRKTIRSTYRKLKK
jgi:glycosyltransferase involved in cell wall biosynthesis